MHFLHGFPGIHLPFHCRGPLAQHGQGAKANHIQDTAVQCPRRQPHGSAVNVAWRSADFSPVVRMANQKEKGMLGQCQTMLIVRKEITKQWIVKERPAEYPGDGINVCRG